MAEILDNLLYEKKWQANGFSLIAGIDEVGRGPLAGPVVCAVAIMPLGNEDLIEGITDSKKLTEKKRIMLDKLIKEKALCYKICEISHEEIDKINILEATKKCMRECVRLAEVLPEVVLVDGMDLSFNMIDSKIQSEGIIKGDLKSYSIGCASILAKVYRDNLMTELDKVYSGYNFKKHKGYGTSEHIAKIGELGLCKIHRRSFTKKILDRLGKN